MHVDELEVALRQLAANQAPVSPTAHQDVVRRARRRRTRNVVGAVAAVAALAGGITFASINRSSPQTTNVGVHPGPIEPPPSVTQVPTSLPPRTIPPSASHLLPAGFQPLSVTFVSPHTGWLLGTNLNGEIVSCASPSCISLLRTDDAGHTWTSVPAPPVKVFDGSAGRTGVNEVRFADINDGWLFGPDLWVTHDGGGHWSRSKLAGVGADATVTSLEASAGRVHAVVLDSTTYKIETSPSTQDAWQVSGTTIAVGAGPVPTTQLVLQGSSGWVVEVDRTVVAGARLANGNWVPWQPPCSQSGGQALLAASTPRDLAVICDEGTWGGPPRGEHAYASSDGGDTFQQVATPVPIQTSEAIATPSVGTIVIGADAGLVASFDGGRTWRPIQIATGSRSIRDLGFTTPQQGVAVVADPMGREGGALYMTFDGGHTWTQVSPA